MDSYSIIPLFFRLEWGNIKAMKLVCSTYASTIDECIKNEWFCEQRVRMLAKVTWPVQDVNWLTVMKFLDSEIRISYSATPILSVCNVKDNVLVAACNVEWTKVYIQNPSCVNFGLQLFFQLINFNKLDSLDAILAKGKFSLINGQKDILADSAYEKRGVEGLKVILKYIDVRMTGVKLIVDITRQCLKNDLLVCLDSENFLLDSMSLFAMMEVLHNDAPYEGGHECLEMIRMIGEHPRSGPLVETHSI